MTTKSETTLRWNVKCCELYGNDLVTGTKNRKVGEIAEMYCSLRHCADLVSIFCWSFVCILGKARHLCMVHRFSRWRCRWDVVGLSSVPRELRSCCTQPSSLNEHAVFGSFLLVTWDDAGKAFHKESLELSCCPGQLAFCNKTNSINSWFLSGWNTAAD